MAMPPAQKLRCLESASLIVQVSIVHVESIEIPHGQVVDCGVTGTVQRAFRGDYPLGTEIAFVMSVYSESAPPGDCRKDIARLRPNVLLEVYLERDAEAPNQWRAIDTSLIEELSDAPVSLTGYREFVAEAEREQARAPRSGLRSLVRRLFGRN